MDIIWDKPVLTFYKERISVEKEPFAVVKAVKLGISKSDSGGYWGTIVGFFPLMGNIEYVSSEEGKSDNYVICWFDDREDYLDKSYRRLIGVTFPSVMASLVDEKGKKTYIASFKAKSGKLK